MSENVTQSSADPRPEFTFPTESDTVEFVETLQSNYGICEWCWKPKVATPIVRFSGEPEATPLRTGQEGTEIEDVPPHKRDGTGEIQTYSREKELICDDCGVIDPAPGQCRTKKTTWRALGHLCSILEANNVRLNPLTAVRVVAVALEVEGRSGQTCQVLGEAIYESTPD